MDEEESSDGLPDLEAQLYAQVHHEHVNSNLTANQTPIPEDEKLIKDVELKGNVSFNTAYLNEEPVSTTRKSISANSGAKFTSLTQKNATVTATDKDQHENHLVGNSPHQNNYDAECISTATTTSPRMETVIVNKGGLSVGSQKSLATQNRPTDQRTFESKQVVRRERRKSNSNTQKITNDNNKNVSEKNSKKGQNRETALPLPNEKKTSFLFSSKKPPKSKENSKTKQLETIEIDSSGDDDNDDVVLVPTPAVPTYTVEDSDDDDNDTAAAEQLSSKNVASLAIVETAMDSSDVQINYSNFLKPTLSTYIPEKRTLENSSRCTSPSSVFSTDDFIVHQDRQRLKNNLVADNEDNDLIMVDMNTSTENCENSVTELLTNAADTPDLYVVEDKSSMPIINFRVEQSQFRALDVYESESDIPESIYGKGSKVVSKETVIRTISTTTDEDEQCVLEERNTNTKTKRLYKRRSSDSRKSCEGLINGEPESSDDDEVTLKPKNNRSNKIPYIEPGEAVERLKSNKPRRSSKNKPSDNETDSFIAAINSLAQGVERHQEDEEHSDIEETLTARQIAEKVLERKQNKRSVKTQATEPSPPSKIRRTMEHATGEEESKDIFDDLNKIMKVVDVLGKRHENKGFGSDFDCEVIENKVESNNLILGSSSEEELESAGISVNSKEKVEHSNDGGGGGGGVIATKRQWDQKSPLYYIQSIKMCGNKAGIGWSDEQSRFYACSWNGETFDIENLWKTMSNNRKLWKVAPNDPFASAMKSPQNRVKCFNCCQYGHKKQRCPYPMRPKVCRVCGNAGHLDLNCHKKCCLRCGTKTNSFVKSCNSCLFQNRLLCSLCKVRGHSLDACPDKWRRYHSTIKPNQSPNSKISYNERIYCCNCGKRGHYGDECKKELPTGGYPKISSRVKSYDKSYENITSSNQSRGILCNLLYDPQFGISQKFKLSELTKPRNYYGRFLNAVGLGYLLRKRRATPATSESPSQAKKKSKIVNENEETLHALEQADTSVVDNVTNQIQQSGIDSEVVESVQSNASSNRESTTIANDPSNKPILLDSDSNYSFSEFDMGLPVKETAMTNEDLVIDNGPPEVDKKMTLEEVQVDKGLAVNDEPEGASEKEPEVQMGLPEKEPEKDRSELPAKDAEPKTAESKVVTITKSISARAPMGSTPDFIPLERKDNEFTLDENSEISDNSLSPYDTDDDEIKNNSNNNSFNNLPLVAKIYLTYQRGRYLSTPEGKQLLTKLSKETNVTSNLYWSTAGPVITLEGLSVDQDEFHRRLQILFKTANDSARRIKNDALQQMPKRVGVLIRFLIEHFDMLKGNLGNANDLHKRIKVLDLQNEPSKNSLKNADKLRRQLNMILIGQAGLQNGKIHLQSILQIFTTLQNDYKVDEIAPKFLRDELFLHWKKIFTSFRHENYDEIMQSYKKLNVKNYFVTLNIDANKIGVIDVSLTAEQKERMSQPQARIDDGKTKANLQKSNKTTLASCKPNSNLDSLEKQLTAESIKSEKQEKNSAIKVDEVKEMKNKNDLTSTSSKHSKSPSNVPPFINPEQRSNLPKNFIVSTENENSLKTTLFDIENSVYNKEPKSNSNSNKPSIFWSRESIDFLNKCLQIVSSKPDVADTLDRVLNRAHTGLLSCNDYIALKKCCDKLL